MATTITDHQVVNRGFRVFLISLQAVVGKPSTATLLHQAGLPQYIEHYPPSDMKHGGHRLSYLGRVCHAIFLAYGSRGARLISQRIGREQAMSGIRENAVLANTTRIAIRVLPRKMQARLALDTAAREIKRQFGTTVKTHEDAQAIYYDDDNCFNCAGWQNDSSVCYNLVGFIQGLVSWATNSNEFQVEEVLCRAKGDPLCRFRVTMNA